MKNNVHYRVSLSNLNDFQLQAESILWTIFPFAGLVFFFFLFSLHDEMYRGGFYRLSSFIFLRLLGIDNFTELIAVTLWSNGC